MVNIPWLCAGLILLKNLLKQGLKNFQKKNTYPEECAEYHMIILCGSVQHRGFPILTSTREALKMLLAFFIQPNDCETQRKHPVARRHCLPYAVTDICLPVKSSLRDVQYEHG